MMRLIVNHIKSGKSLHINRDHVVLHNRAVKRSVIAGCSTKLYCMVPPLQGCTVYCGGERTGNPIAAKILENQFCYANDLLYGHVTITPALPELEYKYI